MPVSSNSEVEVAGRSLAEYKKIWQRNLFGPTEKQSETLLAAIPLAMNDLGIKLVGTVVRDDPGKSLAIIDNRKSQQQETYHEGGWAGNVLIKKVLRNKVIIVTEKGEKLLAVGFEQTRQTSGIDPSPQQAAGKFDSELQTPGKQALGNSPWSFRLDREEVRAALADPDQILQEVILSPFLSNTEYLIPKVIQGVGKFIHKKAFYFRFIFVWLANLTQLDRAGCCMKIHTKRFSQFGCLN